VLVPLVSLALLHVAINNLKSGSLVGAQSSDLLRNKHGRAVLTAFAGLLLSPGRGLFVFFPLALYAPAALYRMSADTRHAQWAGLLGSLIVLHVAFFSFWPGWSGGNSWGPRFLVPIVPFVTLLAFWPAAPETASPASPGHRLLRPLIKSGVVAFGFVMTLTAVLLPWDVIGEQYGRLPVGAHSWTSAQRSAWFFRLETNPLWTNLRDLWHPRGYDLLVLRTNGVHVVVENLIVLASAMALIGGATRLIQAWRSRLTRELLSSATRHARR
jgi:hypothetical protein